jgi:phosphotransferase system IIB component
MHARGVAAGAPAPSARAPAEPVYVSPELRLRAGAIAGALGGVQNILSAEPVALTRLRVELQDMKLVNESELTRAGALGVWKLPEGVVHVIVGEDAAGLAAGLAEVRGESAVSAT